MARVLELAIAYFLMSVYHTINVCDYRKGQSHHSCAHYIVIYLPLIALNVSVYTVIVYT